MSGQAYVEGAAQLEATEGLDPWTALMHVRHPRTTRPARPPQASRLVRRPTGDLRRRGLPRPQRRRTILQRAQALARPRHQIRQARRRLPRWCPPRSDPRLDPDRTPRTVRDSVELACLAPKRPPAQAPRDSLDQTLRPDAITVFLGGPDVEDELATRARVPRICQHETTRTSNGGHGGRDPFAERFGLVLRFVLEPHADVVIHSQHEGFLATMDSHPRCALGCPSRVEDDPESFRDVLKAPRNVAELGHEVGDESFERCASSSCLVHSDHWSRSLGNVRRRSDEFIYS